MELERATQVKACRWPLASLCRTPEEGATGGVLSRAPPLEERGKDWGRDLSREGQGAGFCRRGGPKGWGRALGRGQVGSGWSLLSSGLPSEDCLPSRLTVAFPFLAIAVWIFL